jgi:DNA-directed RNA polymerase subunit F
MEDNIMKSDYAYWEIALEHFPQFMKVVGKKIIEVEEQRKKELQNKINEALGKPISPDIDCEKFVKEMINITSYEQQAYEKVLSIKPLTPVVETLYSMNKTYQESVTTVKEFVDNKIDELSNSESLIKRALGTGIKIGKSFIY